MRFLAALLCSLLLAVPPASAQLLSLTGAGKGSGAPFGGASLYYDFTTGVYWDNGAISPSAPVTTVRTGTAYAVNSSGVWSSFGSNTPRITDLGLLVEQTSTNSVRNNSMQGASAPSTLPTNWSAVGGAAAGISVIGTGTDDGVDYIDLRIQAASAQSGRLRFESLTFLPTTAGVEWTESFFVELRGGSTTNLQLWALLEFGTAAGIVVETTTSPFTPTATTLGAQRITFTAAGTDPTIERVTPSWFISSIGAYDITVRLGWPQIEELTWATSPIRTTGSEVARDDDQITVTTPPSLAIPVSAFARATFDIPEGSTGINDQCTVFLKTSGSSGIVLGRDNATSESFLLSTSNTTLQDPPAISEGVSSKLAMAFASGDSALALDGSIVDTGTPAVMPTLLSVRLGWSNNTCYLNGLLEEIAVYPGRLSNSTLTGLTQ